MPNFDFFGVGICDLIFWLTLALQPSAKQAKRNLLPLFQLADTLWFGIFKHLVCQIHARTTPWSTSSVLQIRYCSSSARCTNRFVFVWKISSLHHVCWCSRGNICSFTKPSWPLINSKSLCAWIFLVFKRSVPKIVSLVSSVDCCKTNSKKCEEQLPTTYYSNQLPAALVNFLRLHIMNKTCPRISIIKPLLLLILVTNLALSKTPEWPRYSTKLTPQEMSKSEMDKLEQLDAQVRLVNTPLTFQVLNLTGITFRMQFCSGIGIRDKLVLDRIISKDADQSQRELFRRWYEIKMRFEQHKLFTWRGMNVEHTMRDIECTAEKLRESNQWLKNAGE